MRVGKPPSDQGTASVRRTPMFFIPAALLCATLALAASAQQERDSEHPPTRHRVVLDPKLYWFYEAMGEVENIRTIEGRVEGSYTIRSSRTDFTVEASRLKNPLARSQGYQLAIGKMISYMEPGVAPDTESNRKYLTELKAKLTAITGKDFGSYEEWKKWFAANRDRLRWSDEENVLVPESEPE